MMLTHTWLDQFHVPEVANTARKVVGRSVQFDGGEILDLPKPKDIEGALNARSPFPSVIVQFAIPETEPVSHRLTSWEEQEDGSVIIICADRLRVDKTWATLPPCLAVKNADGVVKYTNVDGTAYNKSGADVVLHHHAVLLAFFYVIGCSNVTFSDSQAPIALNKKRIKTGKTPLFEYKTLVIRAPPTRVIGQDSGGTHASPRVHLRRGHIRHLVSDKRVWVQACVVGSKTGVVSKDYRVVPA